jgi:hypothetical protein
VEREKDMNEMKKATEEPNHLREDLQRAIAAGAELERRFNETFGPGAPDLIAKGQIQHLYLDAREAAREFERMADLLLVAAML